MNKTASKSIGRDRRHARIRAKVFGTAARPRLAVYKSNRYLHAQLIDDTKGTTLASGSTKEMKGNKKTEASKMLGAEMAKRAQALGVTKAVFDRGGFRYTGRVQILADAAREGGLQL